MKLTYQHIFNSLKGVSLPSLAGFVLPIPNTEYGLFPIHCNAASIDDRIITMLTVARNENFDSFLTHFNATAERTSSWLENTVAKDPTRILFTIKHLFTGELYGYMGLAYGNKEGTYIEADAIVRYSEKAIAGLMKTAFTTLIEWVRSDVGIPNIWIRVLADNPAVHFYQKCGFRTVECKDLFMVLDDCRELVALQENSESGRLPKSNRQLAYMTLA